MQIVQTMIFDSEDIRLLKQPLPPNPCDTCGMGVACCGCSDGTAYSEAVKPYKDRNIYELARKIERKKKLLADIKSMQNEIAHIDAELPAEYFL